MSCAESRCGGSTNNPGHRNRPLLGVALFARCVGFDRDRAFYPIVLMVIASYYVLFAAMSGSVHAVLAESVAMTMFAIAAVAGFKSSAWIVVATLASHGVFGSVSRAGEAALSAQSEAGHH